jgi:hypothetical protein
MSQGISDMTQTRVTISPDKALFFLFISLALAALFGIVVIGFLSLAVDGEALHIFHPFLIGLAMASGGSAAMIVMRRRYLMPWPILIIATGLWTVGALAFAYGVTTTLFTGETSGFDANLGYTIGLCMGPGVLLMAIAHLLYGFEAGLGKKRERH